MKAVTTLIFFILAVVLFYAGLPEILNKSQFIKLGFSMFFCFLFGFSLCKYSSEEIW